MEGWRMATVSVREARDGRAICMTCPRTSAGEHHGGRRARGGHQGLPRIAELPTIAAVPARTDRSCRSSSGRVATTADIPVTTTWWVLA
jgi:hypothetical protein